MQCLHPVNYGLNSVLRRETRSQLTRHPRARVREPPTFILARDLICVPSCYERHIPTSRCGQESLETSFRNVACPIGIEIPFVVRPHRAEGRERKTWPTAPRLWLCNPRPPSSESKDSTLAPLWLQEAERAAQRHCTILITGETGVGKGHLANHIHRYSPRANQPFVPINCGAIPESLMDSQLFGHAKGAFSDARREHPGMIRAAQGGTIFLDEIGELLIKGKSACFVCCKNLKCSLWGTRTCRS